MSNDNKEIDVCSYIEDIKYYELVLALVKAKLNVCVILSGPPGSGKTTIANKLMSDLDNKTTVGCFNTDSYFMKNNIYKFNRFMLGRYHDKCKAAFRESKSSVKIVDNTNLTRAERKPYIEHATETGYINIVIYMNVTNRPSSVLANANEHNVPEDAISRMLLKWERTPPKLIGIFFPPSIFTEAKLNINVLPYSAVEYIDANNSNYYLEDSKFKEKFQSKFKMEFNQTLKNRAGTALVSVSGKSYIIININRGFSQKDFIHDFKKVSIKLQANRNTFQFVGILSPTW